MMTDKILCLWCGAEMFHPRPWQKGQPDMGGYNWTVQAKCRECGALSPKVYGRTEQEAENKLFAAAIRRYTPLLKPLTLEASIEEKAVWIEQETNEPENNLTPSLLGWQNKGRWVVFIEQPGEDDDDGGKIVGYNPFDYGRTWRCWPRKPTKDEMEAAEWGR